MANSVLFKDFTKYYPSLDGIKNYNSGEGSLAFLKDFYSKVWGSFNEYVENDILLYDLFKEKKEIYNLFKEKDVINDLIIKARVGILESMYSTQINKIGEIIKIITGLEATKNGSNYSADSIKNAIDEIKEINKNKKDGKKINEVQSFFSKYCHWYNEANDIDALPIYDLNVRVGALIFNYYKKTASETHEFSREELKGFLKIKANKNDVDIFISLKYLDNSSIKKKLDFQNISSLVNNFISELELTEDGSALTGIKRTNLIDPTNDSSKILLYKNISIYRLVDKFLWLTYKIVEQLVKAEEIDTNAKKIIQTIPIEVKIEYLDLLIKTKQKEMDLDLKNKITNFLILLEKTSTDEVFLKKIRDLKSKLESIKTSSPN